MATKSRKSNQKLIIILAVAAVIIFGITFLIIFLANGGSNDTMTAEQATKRLEKIVSKIDIKKVSARAASVEYDTTTLKEELPDISKYPLSVEGTKSLNIEIFASAERSGSGTDGWLNKVAENFNRENITINGAPASVSIRSISSGTGADYIISGKHIPDAYSPSNELMGEMVKSEADTPVELRAKRTCGNVAGIVFEKRKYKSFVKKHGEVNIQTISDATASGDLAMGYTNPFSSATGLNFLLATLTNADSADPLGDTAVERFESFQANVPFVAYTTLQMRDSATKQNGSLDAMVLEYQTYKNTKQLKNFEFTPFGVRHDSPVYATGNLSADKSQLLDTFIAYCLNGDSQKLAAEYGFNELDSYKEEYTAPEGDVITSSQQLWKEKKDAGRPVAAVFIADTSGSMQGAPLENLKSSLINGSSYINSDNSVGLISYDSRVYENLPLAKFDMTQRSKFVGAVQDLSPNGNTATFDAVSVGLDMLNKEKEKNPDTKCMLFVLSDGQTNMGNKFGDIKNIVTGLQVPIYTIGYNANLEELEKISALNEAASINADTDDVMYSLKNLFNAQM